VTMLHKKRRRLIDAETKNGLFENGSLKNHPNPFNTSTMIHYMVERESRISLVIVNTNGSQLKTLVSGKRAAGIYSVRWDGRDNRGKQLPEGIYVARFVVDSGKITEIKILLLK